MFFQFHCQQTCRFGGLRRRQPLISLLQFLPVAAVLGNEARLVAGECKKQTQPV